MALETALVAMRFVAPIEDKRSVAFEHATFSGFVAFDVLIVGVMANFLDITPGPPVRLVSKAASLVLPLKIWSVTTA